MLFNLMQIIDCSTAPGHLVSLFIIYPITIINIPGAILKKMNVIGMLFQTFVIIRLRKIPHRKTSSEDAYVA